MSGAADGFFPRHSQWNIGRRRKETAPSTSSEEQRIIDKQLRDKSLLPPQAPDQLSIRNRDGDLRVAACIGDVDRVKLLLEQGAYIKSRDDIGQTPLIRAAQGGHESIVRLLLEKGVEIESSDDIGRTPLSWAALQGHGAVASLLLEKGAEVDSWDENYRTPLSWAAESGREAVVKLLLDSGANADLKDSEHDRTPLALAAKSGNKAIVKLLLDSGATVNLQASLYDETPLALAAESGNEAIVKLLLDSGATVDLQASRYNRTPLYSAILKGNEAIVKLLLDSGANADLKDSEHDQTPLALATLKGNEAIVKMLLDSGATVDLQASLYDETPLALAAESGNEAIVKLLLDSGANADLKDSEHDRTPLALAAASGNKAIVKLLLDSSANAGLKDSPNGRTPLFRAPENSHGDIARLLRKKGAEVSRASLDQPPPQKRLKYLQNSSEKHPVIDPEKYFAQIECLQDQVAQLLDPLLRWDTSFIVDLAAADISHANAVGELFRGVKSIRKGLDVLHKSRYSDGDFSLVVQDPSRDDVVKVVPITSKCLEQLDNLLSMTLDDIHSKTGQISKVESISRLGIAASNMFSYFGFTLTESLHSVDWIQLFAGMIRVLSFGLLSYARSHTSLEQHLKSSDPQIIQVDEKYDTAILFFHPVTLACLDKYIGGPVWVFSQKDPTFVTSTGTSVANTQKTVLTSLRCFMDLWGPGQIIYSRDHEKKISRIQVERGNIGRQGGEPKVPNAVPCHWFSQNEEIPPNLELFDGDSLMEIGQSTDEEMLHDLVSNSSCQTRPGFLGENLWKKSELEYMGVSPRTFAIDSVNLKAASSRFVTLGADVVVKLIPGRTRRGLLILEWEGENPDPHTLLAKVGLEVSACTGNAVRVPLWALLLSDEVKQYTQRVFPGQADSFLDSFEDGFSGFLDMWSQDENLRSNARKIVQKVLENLTHTGLKGKSLCCWWLKEQPACLRIPINDSDKWIATLKETRNETSVAIISHKCLECSFSNTARCGESVNSKTMLRTAIYREDQGDAAHGRFDTDEIVLRGGPLPNHSSSDQKRMKNLENQLDNLIAGRGPIINPISVPATVSEVIGPSHAVTSATSPAAGSSRGQNNVTEPCHTVKSAVSITPGLIQAQNIISGPSPAELSQAQHVLKGVVHYSNGRKRITIAHLPSNLKQDKIHVVQVRKDGWVKSKLKMGSSEQWFREVTGGEPANTEVLQVYLI